MFHSARITLTAWYLLIIMCISFAFSAVIYSFLSREVERFARVQRLRIERQRSPFGIVPQPIEDHIQYDPDLVNETKYRILYYLVIINGSIVLIAGGLGYILSGRTLHPIQKMVNDQHRFIQDASHELRTPLTALKSSLEVSLRDSHATLAGLKKTIREGIEDTNRLQSLTDALLQLAQYEKAERLVEKEPIHLLHTIELAVKRVKPLAMSKKISIILPKTTCRVQAHQESIVELFGILLENAIKYSPTKSTVIIQVHATEKTVKISVIDKGIGIESHDVPFIFDRFYRADTARTMNNTSGYGLGLSIAKHLAEIHNGSIEVVSEFTKGSTFTVTLPTS